MTPAHRSVALPDDVDRLRTALAAIPAESGDQGAFWATDDGHWLLARIADRIGRPLAASFSRRYGASLETGDVTHTAVLVLSRDLALASVRRASDQWAYLYQVLRHEMIQQMGTWVTQELDDEHAAVVAPAADADRVTVGDAVERTLDCLERLTPERVRVNLATAVRYFADNGESRLSHLHTHSARDVALTGLGLSREEILALANVVLGSRPNHGANSLLGGFLRDLNWDPRTSAPHRRALEKYEARMRRATYQSEPRTTTTAVSL